MENKFKLSVIQSESGKIYVEALRTVKSGKYQLLDQRGFIQVGSVADAKALIADATAGTATITMAPKADRNGLHACKVLDDSTVESADEISEEETIVTAR